MKKTISVLLIICFAAAMCLAAACAKKQEERSEYEISVYFDEDARTLSGTAELDYFNDTDNEIADLKFNMYGNAFREGAKYKPVSDEYKNRAYYGGDSYGKMEISGVENCAGWTIGGEDENLLTVNLNEPVYPGERAVVKISFSLGLALVNHRTGITERAVNLGNFYPSLCAYGEGGFIECPYYSCGDPFVSDCANYSVTIDMPEAYTAATSGRQTDESVKGGRRKCAYRLDNARDFAAVLSDEFVVAEKETGGVQLKYYSYERESAEKGLKIAAESLGYFSETFGAYVYPTLSVVDTGFCYGGMEYPALTMIAADAGDGRDYTIVHENAHQWWYAMVGSDQLNAGWQDEGLAEYSTVMFFENHPDYGLTRAALISSATRSYRAFFSVYSQLNGSVDTSMTRNLGQYSSEFEYNNVTYNKGAILFDTVRKTVGDEQFVDCLKDYFKSYIYRRATSDDIIACFLKSGTDLEGLFSSFLDGKIII